MTAIRAEDLPVLPTDEELTSSIAERFDELDAPTEEEPGRWSINDEGQADWAARKLARAREQRGVVRGLAQRQTDAILRAAAPHLEALQEWERTEVERLDKDEAHWEALLGEYHRSVLADDPKAKTVRLPHATLSARKAPDRWETDDSALIEWATKAGAEILRVKTEIDRSGMKKVLSVAPTGEVVWSGELVPGVTVVPGDVTFTVDTEGPVA